MFKKGFTLAEVLITLGIIGVVAAMTMPTLVQKHQEKVTVTKLKKFYSVLSQSYLFAVQEYGAPENWGFGAVRDEYPSDEDAEVYNASNAILIRDRLFKNVKKVKVCDNAKNQKACGVADKIYYLNGQSDDNSVRVTSSGVMADGTSFKILSNGSNSSLVYRGPGSLSKSYARIIVDINGRNAPNVYGKDVFIFYMTNTNIMPEGTEQETFWPFSNCRTNGLGCAAWVIMNENMDYLKCDGLSWSGKKKCD